MWSQNRKVYFLKLFGDFSDEEALAIAAGVSLAEEESE
jgi:hypothetical protein